MQLNIEHRWSNKAVSVTLAHSSNTYHPSRKLHQQHFFRSPGDIPLLMNMHYEGYTPFYCQMGWWLSILVLAKILFDVWSHTQTATYIGLSSISTYQTISLRDFYLGFNVLAKAAVIMWHGNFLSIVCLKS